MIAMQDHYNLLACEEEREMHPLCGLTEDDIDETEAPYVWRPQGELGRPSLRVGRVA